MVNTVTLRSTWPNPGSGKASERNDVKDEREVGGPGNTIPSGGDNRQKVRKKVWHI